MRTNTFFIFSALFASFCNLALCRAEPIINPVEDSHIVNSSGIVLVSDKTRYLINEPITITIRNDTNQTFWAKVYCGAPLCLLHLENTTWKTYFPYPTKDCIAPPLLINPKENKALALDIESIYGSAPITFNWNLRPQEYQFEMEYYSSNPAANLDDSRPTEPIVIAYSNKFTIGGGMYEPGTASTSTSAANAETERKYRELFEQYFNLVKVPAEAMDVEALAAVTDKFKNAQKQTKLFEVFVWNKHLDTSNRLLFSKNYRTVVVPYPRIHYSTEGINIYLHNDYALVDFAERNSDLSFRLVFAR